MVGFIVVAFVFLQQLQKDHGTGDEQKIGSDNDHADGYEKPDCSGNRVFNADGKVVGAA